MAQLKWPHQLGVDRRRLRRWKAAARRVGAKALTAKPVVGRPRRLAAKELRRLRRWLLLGAQAARCPTDLWTCPRVAWLIKQRLGVRYHPAHVSRLLHGWGFSPQKPTRRAVERDAERICAWVEQDWPRVKKRCPPESRARLYSTNRAC
jgi:transposase